MFKIVVSSFVVGVVLCAAFGNQLVAGEPQTFTISVQGMHCAGCASKVSANLQGIQGVQKATADAAKAVAVVTTKPDANPSPKALWEAVEKSGYKPTKLVGPAGTFTTKPKL